MYVDQTKHDFINFVVVYHFVEHDRPVEMDTQFGSGGGVGHDSGILVWFQLHTICVCTGIVFVSDAADYFVELVVSLST